MFLQDVMFFKNRTSSSPVDQAALSFQPGLVDEHGALPEVLDPGVEDHRNQDQKLKPPFSRPHRENWVFTF